MRAGVRKFIASYEYLTGRPTIEQVMFILRECDNMIAFLNRIRSDIEQERYKLRARIEITPKVALAALHEHAIQCVRNGEDVILLHKEYGVVRIYGRRFDDFLKPPRYHWKVQYTRYEQEETQEHVENLVIESRVAIEDP
jgi:hypothetical protein